MTFKSCSWFIIVGGFNSFDVYVFKMSTLEVPTEALNYFRNYKTFEARQFDDYIYKIVQYSFEYGLDNNDLKCIFQAAIKQKLG